MNIIAKAIRKFLGLDTLQAENEALKKELDRVNELRTIRVAAETKVETVGSNKLDYESMPWKDLTRFHNDVVETWIADIQAEIIAKGYKAIPEILNEYRVEVIQQFVMLQKIALGDYAPELDNLDAHGKSELIKMALQLNQLQFRKRMIEQNMADVTKKQIDILKRYGVKDADMPKDRFEASDMIEEVLKANGVDTSRPYSNSTTEAQKRRYNTLKKLTGIECKDVDLTSKKSVSEAIAEMQKYADEHPEIMPKATAAQIELVSRYMKQLNKRMTAKKKVELEAMNSSQISKLIGELSAEVNDKHPELTEGQKSYLLSLLNSLNLPYSISEIETLTKAQATARIENLRREYLFVLTRKTNPGLTKEDIKAMSTDLVKQMIDEIRNENSTRDYSKDSMTGDNVVER